MFFCDEENPARTAILSGDSHVKNLRRKLADKLPDTELIHSVYGTGYRLE